MKTARVFFLGITILTAMSFFASGNSKTDGNQEPQKVKVDVYYFHTNTRCATCKAIESEAKQDVQELFGKEVSFAAYNLDDAAGEAKGKELDVNSQVLLVVKGSKKINITNEGFLYARTDPEKFKKIIEEKIKPLL
jgi:thiol-disulfide isomerase/thioredoxin